MKVQLYHFCGKEAVDDIISNGFISGSDGLVWFAKHPTDVLGEHSRSCLLSLTVNIDRHTLEGFSQSLENEEELDSKTGEWVPSEEIEWRYTYYAIPSDIINSSIIDIKEVSVSDRKDMLL